MKEGLKYFTDTHLTLIGLMVFFIWFVMICYVVYRKVSPQYHEHMAQMPLKSEACCERS